VVCGSLRFLPGTSHVVENPSMVVEVLWPSTEHHSVRRAGADGAPRGSMRRYSVQPPPSPPVAAPTLTVAAAVEHELAQLQTRNQSVNWQLARGTPPAPLAPCSPASAFAT